MKLYAFYLIGTDQKTFLGNVKDTLYKIANDRFLGALRYIDYKLK